MKPSLRVSMLIFLAAGLRLARGADSIVFGDPASESGHNLIGRHSEIIRGGLGEPARRLLPAFPADWEGGSVAFTLAVDPAQPNYVTVRLTQKGLSKELGYVGYYGEVLDWVTTLYNATRPAPNLPGDERIQAQLARLEQARAVFRYPTVDDEGFRAMRLEAVIGWRDPGHYPGDVTYGERMTWDGSAIYSAAATLTPQSIGYAQQMLADHQFFALLRERLKERNFRVTAGLLNVPDDYELIRTQPASAERLPMSPGQPDFVFTDEEDGVVAIKDHGNIFYASLYWRANHAVNFLARVHYTTPRFDRIAVVREDIQYTPSGIVYTRPDTAIVMYGNGPKYPDPPHSAVAGEELPVARIPADVRYTAGQDNVYAGKGDFYTLRYGPYLIGMNFTPDRTFELTPPLGVSAATDLVTGRELALRSPLKIGPRSTVVLKLP